MSDRLMAALLGQIDLLEEKVDKAEILRAGSPGPDALSSRLREAEGLIRGLLRVVENWSDEERAIRADAQRFLSASPTPTEESE